MFTGIISHTTTTSLQESHHTKEGKTLTFKHPEDWDDLEIGESINTNGVCLSITAIRPTEYDCFVVPETLEKSTFGLSVPKQVNLERALPMNGRLGGHFVLGHSDEVGLVSDIEKDNGYRLVLAFNPSNRNLIISKGSVAVDGVSLTIAEVRDTQMVVAIIPLTLQTTTLGSLKVNDRVNLEFDILGKYVVNGMKTAHYI